MPLPGAGSSVKATGQKKIRAKMKNTASKATPSGKSAGVGSGANGPNTGKKVRARVKTAAAKAKGGAK